MHSLLARETLLLRLLSPRPPSSGETRAAFDADDWDAVLDIVRQQRLGALLHQSLSAT